MYSHRTVTHEEVMGELTLLSKERFVCVLLGLIRSRATLSWNINIVSESFRVK